MLFGVRLYLINNFLGQAYRSNRKLMRHYLHLATVISQFLVDLFPTPTLICINWCCHKALTGNSQILLPHNIVATYRTSWLAFTGTGVTGVRARYNAFVSVHNGITIFFVHTKASENIIWHAITLGIRIVYPYHCAIFYSHSRHCYSITLP